MSRATLTCFYNFEFRSPMYDMDKLSFLNDKLKRLRNYECVRAFLSVSALNDSMQLFCLKLAHSIESFHAFNGTPAIQTFFNKTPNRCLK